MIIRAGREEDSPGLIALAAQVEHWFGPMASEPGFRAALTRHIGRGTALVATTDAGGGLLFTPKPPSHQAKYLGLPGEALELARAARAAAGSRATATVRAMFTAMEALALASLADPPGCASALTRRGARPR